MNAKKCKLLRRVARAHSIGMPKWELLAVKHVKTVIVQGKAEKYVCAQAINNPKSERGIYRALKKGHIELAAPGETIAA